MDNADLLAAMADNACFDRDTEEVGTFHVELHCANFEITVRMITGGEWDDALENWTPGVWELIGFEEVAG